MKQYTDEALKTIQENTATLYAKLASTKPGNGLTLEDIESIIYYIKAFEDMARHEMYVRKVKERNA